jgi:hypothetical protein
VSLGKPVRFSDNAAQRIFAEMFPPKRLTTQTYGNVLALTASFYGLALAN